MRPLLLVVAIGLSSLLSSTSGRAEPAAPQPARKIPAITSEDRFPRGCVDCHVNYPAMKMDTRLSVLMRQWNNAVDPKLMAKVRATVPKGFILKGKHPVVAAALEDIPAGCLKCHGKESTIAPPLSQVVHLIHLTGGEDNHFLTLFQGECTYCHKLNLKTGRWSMPSGREE